MTSKLRAAVIQMNAGSDKDSNIKKAIGLTNLAIARGAGLVCLPEVFTFRGPIRRLLKEQVPEPVPGPTCRIFQELARENSVSIMLGSVYEKVSGDRRPANTSVFIDPQGRIAAKYRKIHMFQVNLGRARVQEAQLFRPGRRRVSVAADGFRIGMSVCYDLRFPQMFREYAAEGCQVLTVPASFTRKTGSAHWEILVRARAVENLSYVLAPNQFGVDGKGIATYGHSLIVGPWGEVLAEGSADREEVLLATLDLQEVARARAMLPGVVRVKNEGKGKREKR